MSTPHEPKHFVMNGVTSIENIFCFEFHSERNKQLVDRVTLTPVRQAKNQTNRSEIETSIFESLFVAMATPK